FQKMRGSGTIPAGQRTDATPIDTLQAAHCGAREDPHPPSSRQQAGLISRSQVRTRRAFRRSRPVFGVLKLSIVTSGQVHREEAPLSPIFPSETASYAHPGGAGHEIKALGDTLQWHDSGARATRSRRALRRAGETGSSVLRVRSGVFFSAW